MPTEKDQPSFLYPSNCNHREPVFVSEMLIFVLGHWTGHYYNASQVGQMIILKN
jgi:hypothetical protein